MGRFYAETRGVGERGMGFLNTGFILSKNWPLRRPGVGPEQRQPAAKRTGHREACLHVGEELKHFLCL